MKRTKAERLISFVDALVNTRNDYSPIALSEIKAIGYEIDANARTINNDNGYEIVFGDGSVASFAKDDCE